MRTQLLHLVPNEHGVRDWTMCGEWVKALPKDEWVICPALVGFDASDAQGEYYFRNPPLRLESCPSCLLRLHQVKYERGLRAAVGYCFGGGVGDE